MAVWTMFRTAAPFAFVALILAACAMPPDLEEGLPPAPVTKAYPPLLPMTEILEIDTKIPKTELEEQEALAERAEALKARAKALKKAEP